MEICLIHDFSQQNLRVIPEDLLYMPNLKMIYMNDNNIEIIPDDFFSSLVNLVWLDLRNNKLKTIPKNIGNHRHLETMLLQNNMIVVLPLELGLVATLKHIRLYGNPIIYPEYSIIRRGTQKLLRYLRLDYKRIHKNLAVNLNNTATETQLNTQFKYTVPYHQYRTISRKSNSSNSFQSSRLNSRLGSLQHCRVHCRIHRRHKYEVDDDYVKDLYLKKMLEIRNTQHGLMLREKSLEELGKLRYNIRKKRDKMLNLETKKFHNKHTGISIPQATLQKSTARDTHHDKAERDKKEIEDLLTEIVETLKYMEFSRKFEKSEEKDIQTIRGLSRQLSKVQLKMPKKKKAKKHRLKL